MHEPRGLLGVAVVNGKIYAIGGNNGSGLVGTNEMYDSVTDTWKFKEPMPTPRGAFAIIVYQNKIYCIGGRTSNGVMIGYSNVNEVYDTVTNTWETKASMPGGLYGTAFGVVDGKFYLIGGSKRGVNTPLPSEANVVYDPLLDSWTTKEQIPESAQNYYIASTVVDNRIYCIKAGGFTSSHHKNDVYDAVNDIWNVKTGPPLNQTYPTAASTTGVNAPVRIYVLDASTNQVYDPKTDSWTDAASMITARYYVGVAVIDDVFYVIGGIVGTSSDFIPSAFTPSTFIPSASNEQYLPIGYLTPTASPTTTPTPTPSQEPQQREQLEIITAVAILAAVIGAGLGLLIYFKKRK